MRAVVHDKYGAPEVLRLEDVERPVPKDDEVLVKIHATTVNRTDCGFRSAEYFISRAFTGLLRPKRKILGMELAGEIEAVGTAVSEFEVGDEVFGVTGSGAHAEFVCVREGAPVAHKPAGMSFEEAAAVCDGASLALECLRKAGLRKGQSVVIYGASGSVGTAAVQLANYFETDVTAVCSTKNVERVRSLGADEVVDYLQEDFTRNGKTYDVIFDAVGKHSFRRCRRSLKSGGAYVSTDPGFMWHVPLLALLTRWIGDKRVALGITRYAKKDVLLLKELIGRPLPGRHRPVLPVGGRGRGDEVRRDGREDGKRRPDRQLNACMEGLAEWCSSPGCDARTEARTQGASITVAIGATEDAASGRAARPGGSATSSPKPPRLP